MNSHPQNHQQPADTGSPETLILPLSLAQQQVWLDHQSYPNSNHLTIGGFCFAYGKFDLERLNKALEQMTNEHLALRLLPLPDGTQQVVTHWQQPLLDFFDLTDTNALKDNTKATNQEKALIDCRRLFAQPFNLNDKQRPWTLAVWKTGEQEYLILLKTHHLVMDGYSISLTIGHFSDYYQTLFEQQTSPEITPEVTPASQTQYQQFIQQSNDYVHSDKWQQDKKYWQSVLPNLPAPLLEKQIHFDAAHGLAIAHYYNHQISAADYQQLKAYAQVSRLTTYHLFIAALCIYFYRTCNQSEIVLGVPVLHRGGHRNKTTIGMYAVMIPLVIDIAQTPDISAMLKHISKTLRSGYHHTNYPMSALGQDLQMVRNGRDRIFDIVLSYEPQTMSAPFGEAKVVRSQQLTPTVARYPLSVSICEFHENEPVDIQVTTSSDYFSLSQTRRLAQRLHYLLMQMTAMPDATINNLPVLLKEEHDEQITAKHADIPRHTNPQPFIVAFERQAALHPCNAAIYWQTTINGPISKINYETLNQHANSLAHKLLELGVKKNQVVAVIMPRKAQTISAFIAIAKAGAAFVPILPDTPTARIHQLLQISGAVVALVGHTFTEQNEPLKRPTLVIDEDEITPYDPSISYSSLDNQVKSPSESDLAYLLFTSGSTGAPKGVLMEHGPLSRRLSWLARTFDYSAADIALQSIQLSFDPAIIEICLSLTQGASIALPPPGAIASTDIAHYAERFGATSIIFVPSILRYFNQTAQQHPNLKLRVAISGGEILHRSLAADFVKHTGSQLYNLYGPTEACVFATAQRFDSKSSADPLPIGKPVDDTQIYILDSHLQPLPSGQVGEIFIAGSGLARGYLNNPDATEQRFIDDPFVPGQRMYHSGDSGYYNDDGQICFIGRVDNQIKLRGQRIEPGEIEAALCELPYISAAAVKAVGNALHAWVIVNKALTPEGSLTQILRQALAQKLPEYMLPEGVTEVATLPHQVSGKVDYKALKPAAQVNSPVDTHQQSLGGPPQTDLQRLLLHLFQQALSATANPSKDLKITGINDDFFTAGADSISALNLLSKIDNQIGQKLPLSQLLQHPTVASLATAIVLHHQPLVLNLSKDLNDQSNDKDSGCSIYLAASGHGDALRFSPLANALGSNFTLQMLQPPLSSDNAHTLWGAQCRTVDELADYYALLIEQTPHKSPPIISGFSVGGVCALETARRLVARGVPIGGLILIDTAYPSWLLRRTGLWDLSSWLVKNLRLQELSINQRTLGSLFSDPGLNTQINALKSYSPSPFSHPTSLIISSGFSRWHRLLFRPWHKLFDLKLTEQQLPGFHGTLFSPEHVDALAQAIRSNK